MDAVRQGRLDPATLRAIAPHPLFERTLRFTHRVNSRAALARFLGSTSNAAEGDVRWGTLIDGRRRERTLIMAHPPARRSDLSTLDWIEAVAASGRVLKLDLKDPLAVAPLLELLTGRVPFEQVVVNADAARGPGGRKPRFSRRHLEQLTEGLPGSVLSIGATTSPRGGPYRDRHIGELLAMAAVSSAPVTIALRLALLAADPAAVEPLEASGLHFTIWNSGWRNPATPRKVLELRRLYPRAWLDLTYA